MRRSSKPPHYRPGAHLVMRTESGSYVPAMVLEDGGGLLVKVRYRLQGALVEQWVQRGRLVPPPWVGCRRHR